MKASIYTMLIISTFWTMPFLWEFHPVAHNSSETITFHTQYCDIKPFVLHLHPYRNTSCALSHGSDLNNNY